MIDKYGHERHVEIFALLEKHVFLFLSKQAIKWAPPTQMQFLGINKECKPSDRLYLALLAYNDTDSGSFGHTQLYSMLEAYL